MKINIISEKEQDNGLVFNAKGDFIAVNGFNTSLVFSGVATASINFLSDGRYIKTSNSGATSYHLWCDTNYTGNINDGTYTPDPTWIGGGNYTLTWNAPTSGLGGFPSSYSPTSSGSGWQTFTGSESNSGNESEVVWDCTITNSATGATNVFQVDLILNNNA